MNLKAKTVTLEDIAKLAGVSTASVSRALNNSDLIKEDTKKRIIEIANKHKYALNYGAQSLSRQKSNVIALYLPVFSNLADQIAPIVSDPFFLKVLSGLLSETSILGCDLVVSTFDSGDHEKIYQAIRSKKVGGVIIYGDCASHWQKDNEHKEKLPIVFWGGEVTENFYRMATNDVQGGEIAANALAQSGGKNPAFISGNIEAYESQNRLQGFKNGLNKHNIALKESNISFGNYYKESGVKQMQKLLKNDPSIDCVFCCSDLLAQAAMSVILESGLKIPQDIKVIGYDDIDSASTTVPALTTISQNGYEVGRSMIRKIVEIINSKNTVEDDESVDLLLVKRESC